MNYYRSTFVGFIYKLFDIVSRSLLFFVTQLVIARVLLPEDFGNYALALIVFNFFNTISNLGISAYIIQKKELSEKSVRSTFTVSLIVSLVSFLILQFEGDMITNLLGFKNVSSYVQVLSWTLILNPFILVLRAIYERELKYKKSVIPSMAGTVVSSLGTVLFAIGGWGIWALVGGVLLKSVSELIGLLLHTHSVSYLKVSYKPSEYKKIGVFVLPLFVSSIITYLYWNVDYYMVGKLLDTEQLGYYYFAFQISHTLQYFGVAFAAVGLPLFAKLQGKEERLEEVFGTFTKITAYLMLLLFGISLVYSHEIIFYIFGEKWLPAEIPFMIFMGVISLRNITVFWNILHQSHGITKYLLVASPLNLLGITVLGYMLLTFYGIIGMSFAVLITMVFSLFVLVPIFTKKVLPHFSYRAVLKSPILVFIVSSLGGLLLKYVWGVTNLFELLVQMGFVSIVYLIVMYKLEHGLVKRIPALFREKLS